MTDLWKNDRYDAKYDYVFGKLITEYDISKANISILHHMGIINEATYQELYNEDRMIRQYTIGMMQKENPAVTQALSEGLRDARRHFCDIMSIEDQNILHINKDAIFVITPIYAGGRLEVPIYDHVTFTNRGSYLSYYRLDPARSIHFYYGQRMYSDGKKQIYKIRGISDAALDYHKGYFLDMLQMIARVEVDEGVQKAYEVVQGQSSILGSNVCKVEYKRRFDSASMYDIKQMSSFSHYQAEYLSEGAEIMVDPGYNLSILSRMGNMYLNEMMRQI